MLHNHYQLYSVAHCLNVSLSPFSFISCWLLLIHVTIIQVNCFSASKCMPCTTQGTVSLLNTVCFCVYYCYEWLQIQKHAEVNNLKAQWLLQQGPVNLLGEPLTLYIGSVGKVWLLLSSPQNSQTALYLFQEHLLY